MREGHVWLQSGISRSVTRSSVESRPSHMYKYAIAPPGAIVLPFFAVDSSFSPPVHVSHFSQTWASPTLHDDCCLLERRGHSGPRVSSAMRGRRMLDRLPSNMLRRLGCRSTLHGSRGSSKRLEPLSHCQANLICQILRGRTTRRRKRHA